MTRTIGASKLHKDGRRAERAYWRQLRKEKDSLKPTMPGMGAREEKDIEAEIRVNVPRVVRRNKGSNKGTGGALWMKRMRKQPCHYCGEPGGTVDHVIPRDQGGTATIDNCVPACGLCNTFRRSRPYGWFKKIGWLLRLGGSHCEECKRKWSKCLCTE